MAKQLTDKQIWDSIEDMRHQIFSTTYVDDALTEEELEALKKDLEKPGNEEKWFQYMFPKYYKKKPAKFHIKSSKKFIYTKRIRQSRKWARGLSKSTRRMMEIFYLHFVRKFSLNMLMCSRTYDNAERLLMPYMVNLEKNQRMIAFYGEQERPGVWQKGEFITKANASFRAVGRGQNPSGARLEDLRITIIIYDDIDDQDALRNTDITEQDWEWMEKNVLPTVDISEDYRIACDNNIKGEDSLAARFAKFANDESQIDLEDENGVSTWPEKNSAKDIQDIKESMSWEAYEAEYKNNPISMGKVFKEMVYGECPPLRSLPFVIVYADPSPSNKDRPGIKARIQNSCKAVIIVGYLKGKYYVYKAFVDNTTNATFIDWLYASRAEIGTSTQPYFFIENNTLQDPFYQQVLLPLVHAKGKEPGHTVLGISPDTRKKPDKYFRIEGTLEPLNRMGCLVLNEKEKNNPHMQRLEAQFKAVSANSKVMDGPDAVEGAIHIIQQKIAVQSVGAIKALKRPVNKKRF